MADLDTSIPPLPTLPDDPFNAPGYSTLSKLASYANQRFVQPVVNNLSVFGDVAQGKASMSDPETQRRVMGSALDVGAGGLGLGDAPAGSLGMFAGMTSKTADLEQLAKSYQMEQAGADPEYARYLTGWQRGPGSSGKQNAWRYEIDDSQAKLTGHPNPTTLQEVLHHPDLFAAYPDLANMPFAMFDEAQYPKTLAYFTKRPEHFAEFGGRSHPSGGLAVRRGRPDDDVVSDILHEVQHAIQERERFALGPTRNAIGRAPKVMAAAHRYLMAHPEIPQSRWSDIMQDVIVQAYNRTFGEDEALNTEARRKLTATERRNQSPQGTSPTLSSGKKLELPPYWQ